MICIIGSGFSGLSAAAYLAAEGHAVHVYEKNGTVGGRARQFETDSGYTFDMGPSWYWMPDIYEDFFNDFGYTASDFYDLTLLDPAFEMVFPHDALEIPSGYSNLRHLFESVEEGGAEKLAKFMQKAEYKYNKGMKELAYMPGFSLTEFADISLIKNAFQLQIFSSFSKHVKKYFSDPRLIALMEFPVLFLGATPRETPALYSLMNYAGLKLGTWYPKGGFGSVAKAMKQTALNEGVTFHYNEPVDQINIKNSRAESIIVGNSKVPCDAVVASADYHYVESKLLDAEYRNYDEAYWKKKTLAPSGLIYYLGLSKKIDSLHHHTLFFDEDLELHSKDIYENPQWPDNPLFYVCSPSQTDESVAPEGHENLFLLMPLAPGLEDTAIRREKYFRLMLKRIEKHLETDLQSHIDYKRSYCIDDFKADYHSYKGNAYGLANTLMQTAIMKPKLKNKKVGNLFYAGQLTVPGPGVPPAIISGKIAAEQLLQTLNSTNYEAVV